MEKEKRFLTINIKLKWVLLPCSCILQNGSNTAIKEKWKRYRTPCKRNVYNFLCMYKFINRPLNAINNSLSSYIIYR